MLTMTEPGVWPCVKAGRIGFGERADGVFTSNADNAVLWYLANGTNGHPIYEYENIPRVDHAIASTMGPDVPRHEQRALLDRAVRRFDEARAYFAEEGLLTDEIQSLARTASRAVVLGDYEASGRIYEQALARAVSRGDKLWEAIEEDPQLQIVVDVENTGPPVRCCSRTIARELDRRDDVGQDRNREQVQRELRAMVLSRPVRRLPELCCKRVLLRLELADRG